MPGMTIKRFAWWMVLLLAPAMVGQQRDRIRSGKEDYMATITWKGGTATREGSWAEPKNWDLTRIPFTGDAVILPASAFYGITTDTDRTADGTVQAVGTLTFTGNALDTETVTIGSRTYLWQTTLTNVDGNVLIGATATDSRNNLKAAINLETGAGTLYAAATTIHTAVRATSSGGNLVATAIVPGTGGNSIASTELMANASWGGVNLSGGVGANGLDLILFETYDGHDFNSGSPTTPLRFTCDKVIHRGGGTLYLTGERDGGAGQMDRIICDSDAFSDAIQLDTVPSVAIFNIEILRGKVTYLSSFSVGTVFLLSSSAQYVDTNSPTIGDLFVMDGRCSITGTSGTGCFVFGGELFRLANTAPSVVMQQFGGTVTLEASTILTYYLLGGLLDTKSVAGQKTITTLYRSPRAEIIRSRELITTEIVLGE